MAKSWKKIIQKDPSPPLEEDLSCELVQPTLDEIAAQHKELEQLLQERKSLEEEMNTLIDSGISNENTDPRFSGTIESFANKRKADQKRRSTKEKLEKQLLTKNKEQEKWERKKQQLKEKVYQQKRQLKDKIEFRQKISTQKEKDLPFNRPDHSEKSQERQWFGVDYEKRKKQNKVVQKRKVLARKEKSKISFNRPSEKQSPDLFEIRDAKKLTQKFSFPTQKKSVRQSEQPLNRPKKKNNKTPYLRVRSTSIKDKWEEKHDKRREELQQRVVTPRVIQTFEPPLRSFYSDKKPISPKQTTKPSDCKRKFKKREDFFYDQQRKEQLKEQSLLAKRAERAQEEKEFLKKEKLKLKVKEKYS